MTNLFRYLALSALIATLAWPLYVFAQDTVDTTDAVIEFFAETASLSDTPSQTDAINNATIGLMGEIAESIFNSDVERLETAIQQARRSDVDEPLWNDTLSLAEDVLEASRSEPNDSSTSGDALLDFLEAYDDPGNWYAHSIVKSLTAFRYFTRNQSLISARHVRDAMELIPTELSDLATDARLRASEVSMVLYALQGNPEFLLDAAKVQQEVKQQLGEPIDRYELMNNFIYAFNRIRDFKSAARVAELLIEETPSEDTIPGLAEGYMAITFNELSDYDRARDLAEKALRLGDHPLVTKRAKYEMVVALSGLGENNQARALMKAEGWDNPREVLLSLTREQAILHAEALLAMHRSEADLALSLMKRRTDLLVQRVQTSNSANMASLLTNLENTRERQSEREGALQREAELRAEQLKQKNRLNRLLWVLIALLTIAFNLLLAFLRYREKLSGKVQGLQKEALSAEKMKTEFLGVINHELRTPLNGIIGISDAMIHHADDPAFKAQAETVQESGQLLFDLLDSLITMSTIEGGRLSLDASEGDPATMIEREAAEWESAAAEKSLDYTAYIAPELTQSVIYDEKRLRQCVRYLLSNATRFTHEGRIHLHATAEPDEKGHMAVRIIVADTGQGMSADVQSRLFKPFLQADAYMTRKYGGAGPSLAIARKLARMMGGDLTVTSREGRGSEFVLTARLPLAEHAEADEADTQMPTLDLDQVAEPEAIIDLMLDHQLGRKPLPAPACRTHLLLADTGGAPSRNLRAALNGLNVNWVEVGSKRGLLKRLETEPFDAVLINLRLRGIEADTLAREIRETLGTAAQMSVIALSSQESSETPPEGFDSLVAINANPEHVRRALCDALHLDGRAQSAA